MKRFSELLLNLIFTSSRNDKIAHIINWINGSDIEEIGWGLSIICQELDISKVKPSIVKEISILHLDKYLFELSYDYVGDMAETVSLIWPDKFNKDKVIRLIEKIARSKVVIVISHEDLSLSQKNDYEI